MKRSIYIVLSLVVLGAIAYALSLAGQPQVRDEGRGDALSASLLEYFQENISALSPEKEVLGGKFYVTEISAKDGAGIVYYEDGHIAFAADFTYSVEPDGSARVETFMMRSDE